MRWEPAELEAVFGKVPLDVERYHTLLAMERECIALRQRVAELQEHLDHLDRAFNGDDGKYGDWRDQAQLTGGPFG